MEFTFSLTRDDFWRFNRYIITRTLPTALALWLPAVTCSAAMAAVAFMISQSVVFIVLCAVLPGTLFIAAMLVTLRRKIFKMQMGNALNEQTITVNSDGLVQTIDGETMLTSPADIKKIIVHDANIYIIKRSGRNAVIPARVLNGKAQEVVASLEPR